MVQCNNPQCGAIVKEASRPMICRECGYVMEPVKEKTKSKSKRFDAILDKEKIDGD